MSLRLTGILDSLTGCQTLMRLAVALLPMPSHLCFLRRRSCCGMATCTLTKYHLSCNAIATAQQRHLRGKHPAVGAWFALINGEAAAGQAAAEVIDLLTLNNKEQDDFVYLSSYSPISIGAIDRSGCSIHLRV